MLPEANVYSSKKSDLFENPIIDSKCSICGSNAYIRAQFHSRSLPNSTFSLCKIHDRDLFALGESRFIQKYNHLFKENILKNISNKIDDSKALDLC